jgi:hypothetical protein
MPNWPDFAAMTQHLELPAFRRDVRSDTAYQVRECAEVHRLMLLGYPSGLSSINDLAPEKTLRYRRVSHERCLEKSACILAGCMIPL